MIIVKIWEVTAALNDTHLDNCLMILHTVRVF